MRQQNDNNQTVLLEMITFLKLHMFIKYIFVLFACCCVFVSHRCPCRYCCLVAALLLLLSMVSLVFLMHCFLRYCCKWNHFHYIVDCYHHVYFVVVTSWRYKKHRCQLVLFLCYRRCFMCSNAQRAAPA